MVDSSSLLGLGVLAGLTGVLWSAGKRGPKPPPTAEEAEQDARWPVHASRTHQTQA